MIKKQIATLLETEMDRKGFLKTAGVAAIALSGVTTVFKTIATQNSIPAAKTASRVTSSSAYGQASYGKPQLY